MESKKSSSSDDDLEVLLLGSARGGKKKAKEDVLWEYGRELEEKDLPALVSPSPVDSEHVPTLQYIRGQHHRIAQLVAAGVPGVEISMITGYSQSYLSNLKNDPSFAELVAYYSGQEQEKLVDAMDRLRGLGLSGIEELQKRIDENPEEWSIGQLQALVELGIVKPMTVKTGVGAGGTPPSSGVALTVNFVSPNTPGDNATVIEGGIVDRNSIAGK